MLPTGAAVQRAPRQQLHVHCQPFTCLLIVKNIISMNINNEDDFMIQDDCGSIDRKKSY
jgi:hypothetical protein